MSKSGTISVKTQDIFPIIKKWLYSEHDIFIRELVSNATDAISKLKAEARLKNLSTETPKIEVEIDRAQKTIKIKDTGLGMTEAEVEKYIAQLAFSGAEEFVQKMQEQESSEEIIGKFGLGFYSAFMVADKVAIDSLSYQEGSKPVRWVCQGDTDYVFEEGQRKDVGTTITLYINEESKDFLETHKTRETLKTYCEFMPYPIELIDLEARQKILDENLKAEKEEDKKPVEIDIINDTDPLWAKDPSKLKDEDYKSFFKKLFPFDPEPLFWIHLNIDHPFELQGILFFPKINRSKPINENNIRLYSKQVFVSDSVKNIVPEFLSLLKGVLDSSNIPLNVSRSALQGDPNVKKIANYIIKKVADSLKTLAKKDRTRYEEIWDDIGLFVKYGIVSDTKFDDLMRELALLKTRDIKTGEAKLVTFSEYDELHNKDQQEKLAGKVLYFDQENRDSSLINQLAENEYFVVELDDYIDPHFSQHVEFQKKGEIVERKFSSIDNEFENLVQSEATSAEDTEIKEFFEKSLNESTTASEESSNESPDTNQFEVEVQKRSSDNSMPAYLKIDQAMKRFQKMSQSMGGQNFEMPVKKTLVLNPAHKLVQNAFKLSSSSSDEKKELGKLMAWHVQDLAAIRSGNISGQEKELFVARSEKLLKELSQMAL